MGFDPNAHLGRAVTVEGRALPAAVGAVVRVDRLPIYIQGLGSWDEEFNLKMVKVTGVLRRRAGVEEAPGELPDPGPGETFALEDARWELLPDVDETSG
jgi:hypothetical protein